MIKSSFSEAIDRPFLQSQRPTRFTSSLDKLIVFDLNGIYNKGHESEGATGDYLALAINRGAEVDYQGTIDG